MKIFVGNLSFGTTEDAVRSLFESHGAVDRPDFDDVPVEFELEMDVGRSRSDLVGNRESSAPGIGSNDSRL